MSELTKMLLGKRVVVTTGPHQGIRGTVIGKSRLVRNALNVRTPAGVTLVVKKENVREIDVTNQ